MTDKEPKNKVKTLLIMVIILCAVLGAAYIFQTLDNYKMRAKADAISLAESIADFLPANLVDVLKAKPNDIEKPEYVTIKNSLMKFKERNEKIEFAYLLKLNNGKVYFMVDSELPGSEDYSPPGQEYYEATKQDKQPFFNGESLLTEPITDRWGTWISALVPIKDTKTDEVIAIFGVDYAAENWNAAVFDHVIHAIAIVLLILLLMVTVYLILLKNASLRSLSSRLKESELLFRTIFDQVPVGIAVVIDNEYLSEINDEFSRVLDRSKEQLEATYWADITHPDDLQEDIKQFEKFKAGEINGYAMEKRYLRPDGSYIWVNMEVAALRLSKDGNQNNRNHLCIIQDIHKRKLAEETLRESERSKAMLLSNLPGIAYRCSYDRDWTMQFLSEGCMALTGYKPESLLGNKKLSFNELIVSEYREALWKEWRRVLAERIPFRYEYEIITAAGERKWVLEMGQGVYDHNGNVEALEGIIIDVTESKQRFIQIQFMSEHDYLTGLYNRKYYEEEKNRLDQEGNLPLSIVIADINGLRLVNDAFGEAEGDRIITEAAKIIQSCCREGDILARTGGDEFRILMPNTDRENAYGMIRKIKNAFDKYNLSATGNYQNTSISIGFGTKETKNDNIQGAGKEAEEYMHMRKLLERKSYHSSILSSIMATMYARSQETEAHAERITVLCKLMGEKLQLPEKDLADLQLFSILHDIGKIGIDDRILNKPGKLSEKEWVVMKKHPEIGYRLAMSIPELESIAVFILSHHERWDGKGYPRGKCGEDIPLPSRILALADAYDAMTEDRIYRKALSKQEAIEEIRKNAGTQFDPHIAQLFIENV